MHDDHLRLIGKHIVDFLLVLIKLFALGVTVEALRASDYRSKSAVSLQRVQVDPKFQVEGVAPTNHSSQKTRPNDLSYNIKIWRHFSSFLSQFTRLTDGQTDGWTERYLSRD